MLALLATLALYATALVQGLSIERETNSKRLAQGLSPLKPKRLFDPSRTGPPLARRSNPVPVPGLVAIVNTDGTLECYFSSGGCTPGDTNGADATTFSAMVGYTEQQEVYSVSLLAGYTLAVQKPGDPAGYFSGAAGSTDGGEVDILDANETPGTYNTNGVTEGGIWTLDAGLENFMSATWTNSDSTQVSLGFLLDPAYGYLYACSDCAAYNEWQYSDGGAFDGYLYNVVYLYFVPT